MGKNKVGVKSLVKKAIKREPEEAPKIGVKPLRRCPCPGPRGCSIGRPVSPGDDSVTLICSSTLCPYVDIPCHKSCFEKYEDHLVKTLILRGSARGWTDSQARWNLWQKKGQGMIGMVCKCICQKGNIHPPDEVALTERLSPNVPCDGAKKKNRKKKDLPIIHVTGNPRQAKIQARLEREENEEIVDIGYGRDTSYYTPPFSSRRTRTNSVTSFSSQSIISTTSTQYRCCEDKSTFKEDRTPHRENQSIRSNRSLEHDNNKMNRKKSIEEMRERYDSGVYLHTPPTTPSKNYDTIHSKIDLIPSSNLPPLVKSYAATIKSTTTSIQDFTMNNNKFISNEEMKRDGVMVSHMIDTPPVTRTPSNHSISDTTQMILLPETWYTQSSLEWDIIWKALSIPDEPFDIVKLKGMNEWDEEKFPINQLNISPYGLRISTMKYN